MKRRAIRLLALAAVARAASGAAAAELCRDFVDGLPDAVVDLKTAEGVAILGGGWSYTDARIQEVDHRAPGADLKPSGAPIRTFDIVPAALTPSFDAQSWERVAPSALEQRRSTGRLCFGWYRLEVTIPERLGAFSTAGATAVFEIVVDDYAEVWVDGRLPCVQGQSGGPVVRGWNAPNRVVAAENLKPGQKVQIAIFAMNAPISRPPENYIWIRSATLDFYAPGRVGAAEAVDCEIVRLDPALDAIVPPGARMEKLAGGFRFTEGPVWIGGVGRGHLLFSDPNANTIYRWTPPGEVSIFRPKSGYAGIDIGEYSQPGSNGLALDREGRLTICEHGNRRVVRIEKNGVVTVLADRFDGKRLNSPNDLVYRSDGALFFTDPPFGLPKYHDDPRRELGHFGVYCLQGGTLRLASTDLRGPNGIAFSPDEKILYVANWDLAKKVVMAYDAAADGSLANGRVFFDMTSAPGEEALDGIEVDKAGNLFVSGPGGTWILSPDAKHLGTIRGPELAANFAWGDEDGGALYMAARTGIYRMRLKVAGAGP